MLGFADAVLVPHPAVPAPPVRQFRAAVSWAAGRKLALVFRLEARISHFRIPRPVQPQRADELWEHSCFEAFIACPRRAAYLEINLSPSCAWSVFHFDDYRKGRRDVAAEPEIAVLQGPDVVQVEASLSIDAWLRRPPQRLYVAFASILEDDFGELSYWAPEHPDETPDFHDPRAYTVQTSK